jgi:RND family efflux transporter MFP subunit
MTRLPMRALLASAAITAIAALAVVALAKPHAARGPDAALADAPATLATVVVAAGLDAPAAGYDGVVEALRQTVIAAQVAGAVVAVTVRAGDHVAAGQVLLRLDARAARQQAGAAAAQVQAARAVQDAATRELERQQQLFRQNYISQAALDRAEAQHRTARAQAEAQLAAAGAAQTESGFYVVQAPYAGVISDVAVVLGDMAMPGRPLLTMHDPAALRVTAALPISAAQPLSATPAAAPLAELPGVPARIRPLRWQLLPAADRATHTVELRLDLPPGVAAAPGMFARAWVPASADAPRLSVPALAIVRRAELTAIYVVGADGRPLLRQVRLGADSGEQVEVLSGLAAGERVALDPQAAARVR